MGVFSYLLLLVMASVHTWNLIGDQTVSHVSHTERALKLSPSWPQKLASWHFDDICTVN